MKELYLSKTIHFLTQYKEYSTEEIEKLQYGLEGLYLTITKMIIIFFLAFLLGIVKELLIVLIFFNIIRYPAFGFHADNSRTCLIFSTLLLLGLPYIMIHITIPFLGRLLLSIPCLVSFILFAPADTPKRPLTNTKKRRIRKISAIGIAFIYILGILFIPDALLQQLILAALIIETIMINPLTYFLFHQPFNNYKKH